MDASLESRDPISREASQNKILFHERQQLAHIRVKDHRIPAIQLEAVQAQHSFEMLKTFWSCEGGSTLPLGHVLLPVMSSVFLDFGMQPMLKNVRQESRRPGTNEDIQQLEGKAYRETTVHVLHRTRDIA